MSTLIQDSETLKTYMDFLRSEAAGVQEVKDEVDKQIVMNTPDSGL